MPCRAGRTSTGTATIPRTWRAVEPRHILFLDGNKYSSDFSIFEDWPELPDNVVFTAHDYALPGIAGDATGYPGVVRGEHFDRGVVEQTFLRRTRFMRETGTPIWIGEFGPVYPDESEWRYRLLRDTGVRDILDPIEALFDREFPDYDPWPWGRRQHIALLVRHILLAEPLAEGYARLFRGMSPERARELAASFRLENCVVRENLARLLASL